MYPYETLLILDPRLNEEEVAALLTKVQETLKTLGGEIGKAESWGKRRLAYDMRKQREGTYAVLESQGGAGHHQGVRAPAEAQRAGPPVLHDPRPGAQAGPDGAEAVGSGSGGGRLMANLNRVFLIGNLTRTPELRYTPSGTAVADLRLAVNRNYTTQGGEKREETCFLTVVVWGKQAESCGEYLDKGSPIMVEGRLQTRDWETKDGQKRSVVEVVAERVQFMGRSKSAAASAPGGVPEPVEAGAGEADDEVPF